MALFSVIIPTCHRNEDLATCLEALQPEGHGSVVLATSEATPALRKGDFHYEVIVTDDGSQSTAEVLIRERFPRAKWVEGPHRGPAANRNFGASVAKGDWLAFIDDDCIPGAGWLEAYAVAVTTYPKCAVFEGRTVPVGLKTRADQECPVNLEGGHLWSCNFSIKRSLFLELGGFDENFHFSLEDMDFKKRVETAGHAIKFVSEAQAEHPWRLRTGARFCIALGKSIKYFTVKHPVAKKMFSDGWGIKRIVRIVILEFPGNLLRYRGASSFRVLYLDLLTAFQVSLALAQDSHKHESTRFSQPSSLTNS